MNTMRLAEIPCRIAIKGYQTLISPVMPGACRFEPTCSEYALGAITRFGVLKGGWLALVRMARCNPWGGWGFDPVPDARPACPGPASPAPASPADAR